MRFETIERRQRQRLTDLINTIYGLDRSAEVLTALERILEGHFDANPSPPANAGPLDERDALLIAYGDQLRSEKASPLGTLHTFLQQRARGLFSSVHILPFFPYSSDDGFAVIDYRRVDPEIGDWGEIEAIAAEFRLMIDAVINHTSAESAWFRGFLAGDPAYADFFITVPPGADLSSVVRPRDLPLLTEVQTAFGPRYVWTTFSPDQIDLNYGNPRVLVRILDLLLFYARHGAQIIRLDAIAFIWKEIGTPSIHLPQAHAIVKLMRAVLEIAAPWVLILTETNVPHRENISYFGDGTDEAHMVYQFALPPLVLHTFLKKDSRVLSRWAADLTTPSPATTFFNFLASHDGIGLMPAQAYLSPEEIDDLVQLSLARGGDVSYRAAAGGGREPYELNITYFDALGDGDPKEAPTPLWIKRFLAAHAIMLSMRGLPGIYFHSLIASRNDYEGVKRTGRPRSINREKLRYEALAGRLSRPDSPAAQVYDGFRRLLRARRSHPAFNPYGPQSVLDLGPQLFALRRSSPAGDAICLHEVRGEECQVALPAELAARGPWRDMLTEDIISGGEAAFAPYQARWLATLDSDDDERRTGAL